MASLVKNVDGEYWADSPRDHCRHGVYVGGCGYDFMCHYCEMGDPDPTPNEFLADFTRAKDALVELWRVIVEEKGLGVTLFDSISEGGSEAYELKRHWRNYELAMEWAENGDDDRWLYARHRAEIEGYDLARERGMIGE